MQDEVSKQEECEFVKLFDAVLQRNRGALKDHEIAKGVEYAIRNFSGHVNSACDREKYTDLWRVCGFFHRYTPLYAGITRNKILTALRECEELKSRFQLPSVKIVDIASGAGADLVGLYSALYDEGCLFHSLQVTAMDYNECWEKFFYDIVKQLCVDHFGNSSKLFREKEIDCSFILLDALKCVYESEKIRSADIILMKGFVSILENDKARSKAIKRIASAMEPGSLLVTLESPKYEEYFNDETLILVFTTNANVKNCFHFRGCPVRKYGEGIALKSNQEISVYLKKK